MKPIKGHFLPVSLPRRIIGDMVHAGRQLPLIPGGRTMQLADVVAARDKAWPRPSWLSLFIKAFAIVAQQRPALRRVFVNRPWHRLYEYDETVVSVVMEREWEGEAGLFLARIPAPDKKSLVEIDALLKSFKDRPVEKISAFRGALRVARMPLFIRRCLWSLAMDWMPGLRSQLLGTMGCSITAGLGASATSLITPWTFTFFYDMVEEDGSQVVRGMIDHRVLDGKVGAWVMKDVERELRGSICEELVSLHAAKELKAA